MPLREVLFTNQLAKQSWGKHLPGGEELIVSKPSERWLAWEHHQHHLLKTTLTSPLLSSSSCAQSHSSLWNVWRMQQEPLSSASDDACTPTLFSLVFFLPLFLLFLNWGFFSFPPFLFVIVFHSQPLMFPHTHISSQLRNRDLKPPLLASLKCEDLISAGPKPTQAGAPHAAGRMGSLLQPINLPALLAGVSG